MKDKQAKEIVEALNEIKDCLNGIGHVLGSMHDILEKTL